MALPRLQYKEGTLEGIKWLALISMTVDHINKYLLNEQYEALFAFGRLALPLFVGALVYNLAKVEAYESGVYRRVMKRTAIAAVVATPLVLMLNTRLPLGWWPLNIMWTILVLTAVLFFNERGTAFGYVLAPVLFVLGGLVVEFWWPALLFGVAMFWYYRRPSYMALALAVLALLPLWFVTQNQWPLLAIPLLFLASKLDVKMPRVRHFFYWYFPAHLLAILLIRIPMSNAGVHFIS